MSPRTQKRQETATVPRPRRPAKQEPKGAVEEVHEEAQEQERGGVTIPVLHTTVRPPVSIALPSLNSVPGRVMWLGGLGAFAALGAIDWPVAVAIAAGTWVAEQRAKERLREEGAGKEEGD